MSRNMLIAAAGALIVGLILGLIIGSGGPSLEEIDQAVASRVDAAITAQSERVAAIETQVTELGGRLDAIGEQVTSGAEAVQGLGERLGTNISDLGTSIGERVNSIGESVNAAGASSLAALQSGIADLKQGIASAPAPAAPAADSAASGTAAPADGSAEQAATGGADAPVATGVPAGNGPGETVALSDAARVYISRVDDEAGEAVLYVNGTPTRLSAGESAPFEAGGQECQLTLAAIDRGHATISGACGSDLPDPAGTAPGSLATLADGAVRVFVSGVDEDSARIAVNGVTTQDVGLGQSVEVAAGEQSCTVTVTGVDRGHVSLDATCS